MNRTTYQDQDFLEALRDAPGATAAEVAARVGCSSSTARRRLAALRYQDAACSSLYGRSLRWRTADTPAAVAARFVLLRRIAEAGRRERADEYQPTLADLAEAGRMARADEYAPGSLLELAELGRVERADEYRRAA